MPKTIQEALNDVTEDDFEEKEDGTDTVSDEDLNTNVDEDENAEESDLPDIEDDSQWTGEQKAETEEEGEEEEEQEAASEEDEDEEVDLFEDLTEEDYATIKKTPALNVLRKKLMSGWNKRMKGRSQDLAFIDAYKKDPAGVLNSAVQTFGGQIIWEANQNKTKSEQKDTVSKIDKARAEFAELWGEQVGPKVAARMEQYFNALTEDVLGREVTPLKQQVGAAAQRSNDAMIMSEEDAWRDEHDDLLSANPKIEKAVVDLGNSGQFVPGKGQSPRQYLNTLLKIVLSDNPQLKSNGKTKATSTSTKLANRIERNRRDREPAGVSSKSNVKLVSKLKSAPEKFNISSAFDEAVRELKEESGA